MSASLCNDPAKPSLGILGNAFPYESSLLSHRVASMTKLARAQVGKLNRQRRMKSRSAFVAQIRRNLASLLSPASIRSAWPKSS